MTREEFEAKARAGGGIGKMLDEGAMRIVKCACGDPDCGGWRLTAATKTK